MDACALGGRLARVRLGGFRIPAEAVADDMQKKGEEKKQTSGKSKLACGLRLSWAREKN
jgi:hypothetical protein